MVLFVATNQLYTLQKLQWQIQGAYPGPPSLPIISFWITNFMVKCCHVESWLTLRGSSPYGKSWIRHCKVISCLMFWIIFVTRLATISQFIFNFLRYFRSSISKALLDDKGKCDVFFAYEICWFGWNPQFLKSAVFSIRIQIWNERSLAEDINPCSFNIYSYDVYWKHFGMYVWPRNLQLELVSET